MYTSYLEKMQSLTGNAKVLAASAQSYSFWYKYWKGNLFERVIHEWEWDTKEDDIPQREIEKILMINGTIGCTDKYKGSKGRLGVFFGVNCGRPTIYYDLFDSYQIHCPLDSKVLKINKDVVMGINNSTMTGIEALIHSYAVVLAHTDVSIINKLINDREKTVAIAGSKAQVRALENYRNDLASGKVTPIYDPAMSFVDFKSIPSTSGSTLTELEQFKRDLIEDYLNLIGIKTSHEKKGNMIEEEVAANDSMVIFNIDDMDKCRQRFCDDVNKLFGRSWTVKKCECIDYQAQADEMIKQSQETFKETQKGGNKNEND